MSLITYHIILLIQVTESIRHCRNVQSNLNTSIQILTCNERQLFDCLTAAATFGQLREARLQKSDSLVERFLPATRGSGTVAQSEPLRAET